MISLTQVQGPTAPAVTLADFKQHARITETAEDATLTRYLVAAQRTVEGLVDRALGEQKLLLVLDAWPEDGILRLPRPPLVSVESVKYLDTAGVEQTVLATDYVVDKGGLQGAVFRIGTTWPEVLAVPGAIRVAFTAGAAAAAPPEALQALILLASHWSENREPVNIGSTPADVPFTVDALVAIARWHV